MKVNIKGVFTLDGIEIPCFGEIQIVRKNSLTVYAIWKMLDSNSNSLGGMNREYYIGNNPNIVNEEILKLIIANILKFRIKRKYVFTKIEVLSVQNDWHPN